jgi:hypothetical protein
MQRTHPVLHKLLKQQQLLLLTNSAHPTLQSSAQ